MIMPIIRISDVVDYEIRKRGGFGDTHDSVLRRVLGLDKARDRKAKRAPQGSVTPARKFREPILRVLYHAPDHKLASANVVEEVKKLVKSLLTPLDLKATSSGPIRWENNVHWQRDSMVKEGLLENVVTAGRGIWKLTAKGVSQAKLIA
jgi:hypothetical protein